MKNSLRTTFDARAANDLRVKGLHLRLLAEIGQQDPSRGWLRISQTELAERWGVSREATSRAINDLVRWDYLEVKNQTKSRESFCHYRVVLRAVATCQEQDGVCGTDHTPTSEIESLESDDQITPVAGVRVISPAHQCDAHRTDVCSLRSHSPALYTRAHRDSPDSAEENSPPLPPQAGEQSETFGSSEAVRAALDLLAAERRDDPVITRVLVPLVRQRRFSSANPAGAIAQVCAKAAGLTVEHLDKVLEILLAAPVRAIKAERVLAAIEAVRKGGLMLVIARGQPEFTAWLHHYERTLPSIAALMGREVKWQVPSRFPPDERNAAA